MPFSQMREIIKQERRQTDDNLYISDKFGLAFGIEPFREFMVTGNPILIEDTRIGVFSGGVLDATINLVDYHITSPTALYIGRGSIVQVNSMDDGMTINGLIMNDEFLDMAVHGNMPPSMCGNELHCLIPVDEKQRDAIVRMLRLMTDMARDGCGDKVSAAMAETIILYYDRLFADSQNDIKAGKSRERELFEKFISLVRTDCRRHRDISHYADLLCVSPRYLGTMVAKASGLTAKEWIDRGVITAAKVLLRHGREPVAGIADRLGFASDSFFCKFFKMHTGQTPTEYRNAGGR